MILHLSNFELVCIGCTHIGIVTLQYELHHGIYQEYVQYGPLLVFGSGEIK